MSLIEIKTNLNITRLCYKEVQSPIYKLNCPNLDRDFPKLIIGGQALFIMGFYQLSIHR